MTSTSHTTIRDELLSALRGQSVADAAGVLLSAWSSASSPRVLAGDSGWIFGIHRGRMPIVEVFEGAESWSNSSWDAGMATGQWTLRVHAGGFDQVAAEAQLREITAAGLAAIRSNLRLKFGAEQMGKPFATALGHRMETVLTIENRANRRTFEVDTGLVLLSTGSRIILGSAAGFLHRGD